MPNHQHDTDQVDHDHGAVEHMDAAATLSEREPVRIYGTMPATILGTTGAIIALGDGSPLLALGCATVIVFMSAILELVRTRVSPPTTSIGVRAPRISHDRVATKRRRVLLKRRGPRRAAKTKRASSEF